MVMPKGPRITAEQQLARHTAVMPNGCTEWTGALNRQGYGAVYIHRTLKRAHRVSWELANGPIPDGMCVLHKCDNRACTDPQHLFLGTRKDNVQDMMDKGRGATGERARHAKLKVADVVAIRQLDHSVRRTAIAQQYGISPAHVSRIRRRENWADISACSLIVNL